MCSLGLQIEAVYSAYTRLTLSILDVVGKISSNSRRKRLCQNFLTIVVRYKNFLMTAKEEFNDSYPADRTDTSFYKQPIKIALNQASLPKIYKSEVVLLPHITSGASAASFLLQGLFYSVAPKPKHAWNLQVQQIMQGANEASSFQKVLCIVYFRQHNKQFGSDSSFIIESQKLFITIK